MINDSSVYWFFLSSLCSALQFTKVPKSVYYFEHHSTSLTLEFRPIVYHQKYSICCYCFVFGFPSLLLFWETPLPIDKCNVFVFYSQWTVRLICKCTQNNSKKNIILSRNRLNSQKLVYFNFSKTPIQPIFQLLFLFKKNSLKQCQLTCLAGDRMRIANWTELSVAPKLVGLWRRAMTTLWICSWFNVELAHEYILDN